MPLARLLMSRGLFEALLDEVRRAAPEEGCGLIATSGERAMKLFPGRNVDRSPTRYTMDPYDVLHGLLEIEAAGWRLGAIYHSHPDGPAWPSPTDLREAQYPDALVLIVSLADATPDARAFDIAGGAIREVPLDVD